MSSSGLDDAGRAFLARPLHAIVATTGSDGSPSQSVVWYVPDGDGIWFSARPTSLKVRHLRARPRVSVLVLSEDGGSYLQASGEATVVGEVSPSQRRQLVSRYVPADAVDPWLAGHPLPSPNARVHVGLRRVTTYGVGSPGH